MINHQPSIATVTCLSRHAHCKSFAQNIVLSFENYWRLTFYSIILKELFCVEHGSSVIRSRHSLVHFKSQPKVIKNHPEPRVGKTDSIAKLQEIDRIAWTKQSYDAVESKDTN